MKGRANYLCRHKLVTLRAQPILSGLEEIDQYRQIAEWEKNTETGDRSELSELPESSALWQKLDARTDACLGPPARIMAAASSRKCGAARLSPTSLSSTTTCSSPTWPSSARPPARPTPAFSRGCGGGLRRGARAGRRGLSYFGLSVSNIRFEELARDTDALLRGKEGADKLPAQTQQLRDRARMFFAGLPMAGDGRQPFTGREEFLETSATSTPRSAEHYEEWKRRWRA